MRVKDVTVDRTFSGKSCGAYKLQATLTQGNKNCITTMSGEFSTYNEVKLFGISDGKCSDVGFDPFDDIKVQLTDLNGNEWCIDGEAVSIHLQRGIEFIARFSKACGATHESTARHSSGSRGKVS